MKSVSLTFISGCKFADLPEVQVYVKTVAEHFHGDRVIFTNELSLMQIRRFEYSGFKIVDLGGDFTLASLVTDRFRSYLMFLLQHPEYDYVMLSDSKDVLLQNDPMQYLEGKDCIYLAHEGMLHEKSKWNIWDQSRLQENLKNPINFYDWPVINGGFQIGSRQKIIDFLGEMWKSVQLPVASDQAILNFLYQTKFSKYPDYLLSIPSESSLVATGEAIATHAAIPGYELILQNNLLVNPNLEQPYAVVHQWERVFREEILEIYKN